MELSLAHINRWAPVNDGMSVAVEGDSVTFDCAGRVVDANVENGIASIGLDDVLELLPDLGTYVVKVNGRPYTVERVFGRYTTRQVLIDYGRASNDGFDNEDLFPQNIIDAAIQRAEETLEKSCGRSFTQRRRNVRLFPDNICELPEVDVLEVACDLETVELVSDRQVSGVTKPVMVSMLYGAECSAQISEAATRLAAFYLRPSARAENARAENIDGVYVSYQLATGDEGSWTGIPFVDAAIEQNRSKRVIVA